MAITLETERLRLREMNIDDAPFILQLLNEASFLHFIGDKGVRNLDDAQKYILNGPIASYQQHGFGLYLVELKDGTVPIGMCGLIKRELLPYVDIGFAFLPAYWHKGYAFESASEVFFYGKDVLKLPRIVAITTKDNEPSCRLLEKLGLHFDRLITLDKEAEQIKLYLSDELT